MSSTDIISYFSISTSLPCVSFVGSSTCIPLTAQRASSTGYRVTSPSLFSIQQWYLSTSTPAITAEHIQQHQWISIQQHQWISDRWIRHMKSEVQHQWISKQHQWISDTWKVKYNINGYWTHGMLSTTSMDIGHKECEVQQHQWISDTWNVKYNVQHQWISVTHYTRSFTCMWQCMKFFTSLPI